MPPFTCSPDFDSAFAHAVTYGWMCREQYRFISELLLRSEGCTFLVFGLGYDSGLWVACAGNRVTFVEDNPTYLTAAPAGSTVLLYRYTSRVGMWCQVPAPPTQLDGKWDHVLIDGPTGFDTSCPGRQIPIAWARQLASRTILVHDYQRPWERYLCDKILGPPTNILNPTKPQVGELAIFHIEVNADEKIV